MFKTKRDIFVVMVAVLVTGVCLYFSGGLDAQMLALLPAVAGIGVVSFNTIPANLRVPLFYAEMDPSQASYFTQNQKVLLIGQKLATGTATADTPLICPSTDAAKTLFGIGSQLARMHEIYRLNDQLAEIWCLPVAEPGAGVSATGTITLVGPATGAGTLTIYIAGQKVQVAVASADTATAIATALSTAINALTSLPVTSAPAAGVVTLTSRWKGLTGNDITVVNNFGGQLAGEALPVGVTSTIVAMNAGTAAPSLTAGITNMGDDPYDFIVMPFTDATSLDALKTELNDTSGRWSYLRQIYGHVFSAFRGTLGGCTAFGSGRNDQHATIPAVNNDVPQPIWEYAAAYAARCAQFLMIDPARPTQTGILYGISPPRAGQRFLITERQSLLNNGMATSYLGGGYQRIERSITTYQKNAFNIADASYLDVETMFTTMTVLRNLQQAITTKFARHKLANDGTRFGAGQAIVTPNVIRSELTAAYAAMELNGLVENSAAFATALIVERDINNPNRVNVLFPPDYINQLRIFAVLNQFRLQYPTQATS